jgi:hypothetical protein
MPSRAAGAAIRYSPGGYGEIGGYADHCGKAELKPQAVRPPLEVSEEPVQQPTSR